LDDKPLTGVTTILSVIAKPALIQWAANMAIDYVLKHGLEKEKEARLAHRKKKEEAGQKGTDIHALIEAEVKNAIKNTNGYFIEKWKEQYDSPQILHFIDWAIKEKVKFLASEKRVYSEKYWYAGTFDFLCEIKGKIYLGDTKTSSGIWPEFWYQTSAYQNALQECEPETKIDGHIIVNLTKDGKIKVEYNYDYELNRKAFMGALAIYRVQNQKKVVNTIKNK
jgi:hypothetical protein